MTKRIGVAVLAAALMFGASVAITSAAAGPLRIAVQNRQTGEASDLGAQRRIRHHRRDVNRPIYRPSYYDRPHDYAPAPFFRSLGLATGRGGEAGSKRPNVSVMARDRPGMDELRPPRISTSRRESLRQQHDAFCAGFAVLRDFQIFRRIRPGLKGRFVGK